MKFYELFSDRRTRFMLAGFLLFLFLGGASALQASAASGGELDASFVPQITKDNQAIGNSILIQPDGKILYAGVFLSVDLQPRSYIARFNADGTLDSTFDSGGTFSIAASIAAMALQSDGKIVVAGSFSSVAGQTRQNIARLNADGSFDPTFNANLAASSGALTSVAIQSDGKILLSGNFSSIGGQTRNGFARVNADGSLDAAFNTPCGGANAIVVQADGKIIIGNSCGVAANSGVSRLNTNGTLDATFNAGTGANGSAIRTIVLQSDGKILIGGQFSSFNGAARNGIVRVNADGTINASFVPTSNFSTNAIAVQADGKIVVARNFSFAGAPPVVRLNADGTNDGTFAATETQVNDIYSIAVASDGKIYEAGKMQITVNFTPVQKPFLRLTPSGTIDAAFDPYILYPNLTFGVKTIVVQPDGKILVAGEFREVNRQARVALMRLNTDGSLDSTFNLGANTNISNGSINALALQPDGKILVGSSLPTNGADRLQRLNADGSRDTTFNVLIGDSGDAVKFIALQPDGRILVAGTFTMIGGQTRNSHFARLNSDGSVDAFNPTFNAQNYVSSLLVQPDGKFIIGGDFSQVNGTNRNASARFNADGTLDTSFANTDFGTIPFYAALLPDGKILVNRFGALSRFNADNTQDNSFTTVSFRVTGNNAGTINTTIVQADGKILVGGVFDFVSVTGFPVRKNFARLNTDGTLDASFGNYGGALGGAVNQMALQANGKILVGGAFKMVNGFGHSGLARLNPAVSQSNRVSDFDGDGRADASIFRDGFWYINPSGSNPSFAPQGFYGVQFGLNSDKLTPADFDGDGKTDIAVWREADFSYFYVLQSATNTLRAIQFGTTGDNPSSVGDWDGDGKADAAVYRAGGAQSYFYYRPSSQPGVDFVTVQWGTNGDKPMRGDFDGDGKLDAAVFRPSNNAWYIRQSASNQARFEQWGAATDKFVSGDFDGDGKTDLTVFRDGSWYIKQSSNNQPLYKNWGANSDALVAADYDGDGKTDVAVFRSGVYYIMNSANSANSYQNFGASGDRPIASAFVQ